MPEYAPPSILYCIVNPATEGTDGKVKADAHVFAGAVMVGAVGNITTLTTLLISQAVVVPGRLLPQAGVKAYCADIV